MYDKCQYFIVILFPAAQIYETSNKEIVYTKICISCPCSSNKVMNRDLYVTDMLALKLDNNLDHLA